jgi:hypothetical protein
MYIFFIFDVRLNKIRCTSNKFITAFGENKTAFAEVKAAF